MATLPDAPRDTQTVATPDGPRTAHVDYPFGRPEPSGDYDHDGVRRVIQRPHSLPSVTVRRHKWDGTLEDPK